MNHFSELVNQHHGLGLSQLISEHASHVIQFVQHDRNKESRKRNLLDTWKRLGAINDKWVKLLTCGNETVEFKETCNHLVHGYSESIGDYILEGACHAERLEKLTSAEGKFYSAINSSAQDSVTHQKWVNYTRSLVDYVNAADYYGWNAERTWTYASDAMIAGRILGNWLDLILK